MVKTLRLLALTLAAYIVQTILLPRFNPLEVQPDVLLAVLVWITADGDRYVGFCIGAVMGLMMDAMIGVLPFLYLVSYPVMGYACARLTPLLMDRLPRPKFSGKWITLKRFFQLIPSLTAVIMALLFQLVLVLYRYLNGVDVSFASTGIILQYMINTAIAAFIAQFVVRLVMRKRKPRAQQKQTAGMESR